MGLDTTPAMAMEVASTTGTDAATTTVTHVASLPPPWTPLPSWLGPAGGHHGPQTLQLNHLSTAEECGFNPHPPQSLGLSWGRRDAAGPMAEGVPPPHSRQRHGWQRQADSGAEPWWHLVCSHPCAKLPPGSAPAQEWLRPGRGMPAAGQGSAGAGGGQAACRAPVLLSDMILLMAMGNGLAALAGRIHSFLPAFLPPPHRSPHGWARRWDAGRRLASVFTSSASSGASAIPAPEIPPQHTCPPAPASSMHSVAIAHPRRSWALPEGGQPH